MHGDLKRLINRAIKQETPPKVEKGFLAPSAHKLTGTPRITLDNNFQGGYGY